MKEKPTYQELERMNERLKEQLARALEEITATQPMKGAM